MDENQKATSNQNLENSEYFKLRLSNLDNEVSKFKNQKWYKTPSTIISTIALILTFIFNIVNIKDKLAENKAKSIAGKIDLVNKSIDELINIQEKFYSSLDFNNNSLLLVYSGKRKILLDKLMLQINEVKDNITPTVFGAIAVELSSDGNIKDALFYSYEEFKALKKEQKNKLFYDFSNEVVVYRLLARLYGVPQTQTFNMDSVIKYRTLSLSICDSILGESKLQNKAESFFYWAQEDNYYSKSKENTKTLLDSAIKYLKIMPANNPLKNKMMLQIEQFGQSMNSSEKNNVFSNLIYGYYKVKLIKANEQFAGIGYITLSNMQFNNSVDIYDKGIITQKIDGVTKYYDSNNLFFQCSYYISNKNSAQGFLSFVGTLKLNKQIGGKNNLIGYLNLFGNENIFVHLEKKSNE